MLKQNVEMKNVENILRSSDNRWKKSCIVAECRPEVVPNNDSKQLNKQTCQRTKVKPLQLPTVGFQYFSAWLL